MVSGDRVGVWALELVIASLCERVLGMRQSNIMNMDSLTVQYGLLEAPVDAKTVLLSLHTPFALAQVQGAGQEGRHRVLAVVARSRTELHAPAARDALPQRSQARAARLVTRARISRSQTVPPAPEHQPRNPCTQIIYCP